MDDLDNDMTNFRGEAWFKMADPEPTYMDLSYDIVGQYPSWHIRVQDMENQGWKVVFYTYGDDTVWTTYALTAPAAYGISFDANEWHHVAGEFYQSEMKLYFDGALVGTQTIPIDGNNSSELRHPQRHACIANVDVLTPLPFWGWIDEVRIAQAVLTDPECGWWELLDGDFNSDCYVNLDDVDGVVESWLGSGTETFDYAMQKALEKVWPGFNQPGNLTRAARLSDAMNHTAGGGKSAMIVANYEASVHEFSEDIPAGAIEMWMYDPGFRDGEHDITCCGIGDDSDAWTYSTVGIHYDQPGVPETNYFIYSSEVSWENTFTGPARTTGWHKIVLSFGDDSPDPVIPGDVVGGSIYVDDVWITDNNDMIDGIDHIKLGNTWWQTPAEPTYFDDIRYIGSGDLYLGAADVSGDGKVNLKDIVVICNDWIKCTDPMDPVNCIDLRP